MASQGPVTGAFTSTGLSAPVVLERATAFNVSVSGFGSASVELERSFDDGATWVTAKTFVADYEGVGFEPEAGVQYRYHCTAYTSGTIAYRLGTRAIIG